VGPRYQLANDRSKHAEAAATVAWTGGEGAHYGGLDLRYSRVKWLGPSHGPREIRDVLIGDTFGLGARLRFGIGGAGDQFGAVVQGSLAPLVVNRIGRVRVPTLLGLGVPEVGVRFRSFGGPRAILGFHAPVTFLFPWLHGVEIGAATYWLPADHTLDFGLFAGMLFR
jgi:hypothetical protein